MNGPFSEMFVNENTKHFDYDGLKVRVVNTFHKESCCPNCGAPITGAKCEYCDTIFADIGAIDLSYDEDTLLRIRNPDGVVVLYTVRLVKIDSERPIEDTIYYGDNIPHYIGHYGPRYIELILEVK